MKIDMGQDQEIVVKEKFRSSCLMQFQQDAPDLTKKLIDILTEDTEVEVTLDDGMSDQEIKEELEESAEREGFMRASRAMDLGMTFVLETTMDGLNALHRVCAQVTDTINGFEDEDGDPIVWKHLDIGEKQDFFDKHVPHIIMINIFINAYVQKSGMAQEDDD